MITNHISNQFKAFIYCLQLIDINKKDEKFSLMCQEIIDWKQFIDLVRWHKLSPLIYKMLNTYYLDSVPSTEMNTLKSHCEKNSFRVIQLTTELVRIGNLFQKENISFITLKGPLLTKKIYGDVTLREPRDLDLFIPKHHLSIAHQILLRQGYRLYFPKKIPRYLSLYTKYQKDFSYFHPSKHICIELHWRLFQNQHDFEYSTNQLFEKAETESLMGFPFKTMSKEIELLYLLYHGALHSWNRLCWLYDVKQYLNCHTSLNWLNLLNAAKKIGVERSFLSSLQLAHQLLHIPLDEMINKNIHQNKKIQTLTKSTSLIIIPSKSPNRWMRYRMLKNRFQNKTPSFCFYKAFIIRLFLRLFKFIPA